MIKKLRFTLGFLLFLGFSSGAQNLNGQWYLRSGDGKKSFSIDLTHITKDKVQGVHCAEDFENKISECFKMEDEYTVRVVRTSDNIFQGNLVSGMGVNRLVEDIQLQYIPLDNSMIFTHTKIPKGISLIPIEGMLYR